MEPRKGITGVHLYSKGLEFPMALYEKTSWDRTQIDYMDPSVQTTESLIRWCKNHNIDFDVIYPLKKSMPIRHLIRHIHFLKLKHTYLT